MNKTVVTTTKKTTKPKVSTKVIKRSFKDNRKKNPTPILTLAKREQQLNKRFGKLDINRYVCCGPSLRYKLTRYTNALINPETIKGERIPCNFNTKTATVHRHITKAFNVNASGFAAILFDPALIANNGVGSPSSLWIENGATYDANSVFPGYVAQAYSYTCPTDNVGTFRLVSASMQVLPQSSLLNASGKITIAQQYAQSLNPAAVGAALNTLPYCGTMDNLAIVNNVATVAIADICQMKSARVVWLPYDQDSFEFVPVNNTIANVDAGHNTCFLTACITSAAASSSFTLEIYLNYEVVPTPNSILIGTEQYCDNVEQPLVSLMYLDRKSPKVCGSTDGHSDAGVPNQFNLRDQKRYGTTY